jgi:hypothetical protein
LPGIRASRSREAPRQGGVRGVGRRLRRGQRLPLGPGSLRRRHRDRPPPLRPGLPSRRAAPPSRLRRGAPEPWEPSR